MKRSFLQRTLAWTACVSMCVTSLPVTAFAAEVQDVREAASAAEDGEAVSQEETENTGDAAADQPAEPPQPAPEEPAPEETPAPEEPLPEETPAPEEPLPEETPAPEEPLPEETPAPEETPVPETPDAETPSAPVTEAPTQAPAETVTPAPEETPAAAMTADGQIELAWSDMSDLTQRRGDLDGGYLFDIYADGVLMENQPEIRLQDAAPGEEYGYSVYTYTVKQLPVTGKDGVTPVNYTVREANLPAGYDAFTAQAVKGADDETRAAVLAAVAAPTQELHLNFSEKEKSYRADKRFGNYLPAYQVSGTVAWNDGEDSGLRPAPEAYFDSQFTIVRDGDSGAYSAYKLHYAQDEADPHLWNYSVEGLFITGADGSAVSYRVSLAENRQYDVVFENGAIAGDRSDLNIVYNKKEAQKEESKVAEEKKEPAPEPENTKNKTKKSNSPKAAGAAKAASAAKAEGTGGEASFHVTWLDNPPVSHAMLPSFSNGEGLQIRCTIGDGGQTIQLAAFDGEGKLTLTPEAKRVLEIGELDGSAKIERKATGTGEETYTVSGLPDAVGRTADLKYSVVWGDSADNSASVYAEGGRTYIADHMGDSVKLVPTITFTANVSINAGDSGRTLTAKDVADNFILNGEFMGNLGGGGAEAATYTFREDGALVSSNPNEAMAAAWSVEDNKIVIRGLPEFTLNQKEIIWSAESRTYGEDASKDPTVPVSEQSTIPVGGEGDENSDYYHLEYNNTSVPNFGSETAVCHNGGTVILTLSGSTNYTADKIWLDEYDASNGADHRPATQWSLWRYSEKPGVNYMQASHVDDDNGTQISWTVGTAVNAGVSTEYTTAGYADLAKLPKYDTDGYAYRYFVKESMSGGENYEQIYGKVEQQGDGEITVRGDKFPGDARQQADSSIYNEGIVSNRRTDSTTVTQDKTWEADAHQDELKQVFVEMTLMKSSDGGKTWSGTDTKQCLTGFLAEQMTKTASASVKVYDEFGRPLTYQWKETGIYEGVSPEEGNKENLLDETTGEFLLSHNRDESGNLLGDGEEHYISEISDDGTTIINKLQGTTEYIVKKVWEGATEEQLRGASIKWTLLQNDIPMEEYTNVTMDADTGSWDTLVEKLPKFDENGAKYTYVAVETECNLEGYALSGYEYNKPLTETESHTELKTNTCKITNAPVGVGKVINVRKQWIDDHDKDCHQSVTVDVYREAGTTAAGTSYAERKMAEGVVLGESIDWWTRVGVTEFVLKDGTPGTKEQWQAENPGQNPKEENLFQDGTYYIRETAMGAKSAPVIDGVQKYYGVPCSSMELTAQAEGGSYIGTEKHIYCIDYSGNHTVGGDSAGYFTVTNRRVGVVNLKVTKTWTDDGVTPEQRAAYGAKISLKCVEQPGAVSAAKDPGQVTLDESLAELKRDILDNAGVQVSSTQVLRGATAQDNTETLYFYNLPKYNARGEVIHYTVEETSSIAEGETESALDKAEYQTSLSESYKVGEHQHTQDMQEAAVENKRAAAKDVVFYKRWVDKYRYEKKERPDIYLNLYAVSSDNTVKTTTYRNIEWKQDGKDAYNWKCTFGNLPRYDDKGHVITYYAWEGMHVNRHLLDYIDTQYEYEEEACSSVVYDGAEQKYTVNYFESPDNDYVRQSKEDGKYVLKEGGTFVNELRSAVHIDGKKVWKNIPGSFDPSKLPELKIMVRQITGAQKTAGTNDDGKPYFDDEGQPLAENWGSDIAWINQVKSDALEIFFKLNYTEENSKDGEALDGGGNVDGAPGENRILPMYNENGDIYHYTVTEEISDTNEDKDKIHASYEKLPGEVNAYVIENTYNPAANGSVGEIVVNKDWGNSADWIAIDGKYPVAEFALYWRYQTGEGPSGKPEYAVVSRVDTAQVVSKLSLDKNENPGADSVVFENLPIYAPNGKPYEYFVAEEKISGYAQSVNAGSPAADAAIMAEIKALAKDTAAVSGGLVPKTAEGAAALSDTTFKNEYADPQKSISITGTKLWGDYEDAFGVRPDSEQNRLAVELYRRTTGANAIEEKVLAKLYIPEPGGQTVMAADDSAGNTMEFEIKNTTDLNTTDRWTYEITGLDQYAPNGQPWQYKLVENMDGEKAVTIKNYDAAQGITGYVTAPADENEKMTFMDLENNLYTTYKVTKKWEGIYDHLQMPDVTMKLQVSEDGTVWKDAADYFTDTRAITYAPTADGDKNVWTEVLHSSSSAAMPSYTWDKLPKGYMDGAAYRAFSYRAVETKAGNEDIRYNDGTYNSSVYDISADVHAGAIVITNKLKTGNTTSFTVAKKWEDNDNQFNLRPLNAAKDMWSVNFEIRRKGFYYISSVEMELWDEEVKSENGSQLTVNIQGSAKAQGDGFAQQSVKIDKLPAKSVVNTGRGAYPVTWTYYALERENRLGSYRTTEADTAGTNTFTNILETVTVEGTKTWEDDSNAHSLRPDDVALKLFVTTDRSIDGYTVWETAESVFGDRVPEAEWTNTATDAWTWTYKNLPQKAPDKHAYTYAVQEITRVPGYQEPKYANSDYAALSGYAIASDVSAAGGNTGDVKNAQTVLTLDKTGYGDRALDHVVLHFARTDGAYTLAWIRNASYDGGRVEGEKYIISDENGDLFAQGENSAGQAEIKGLPAGSYVLTEESVLPNGYTDASKLNMRFEVKGDGTVQAGGAAKANGIKVTVKDETTGFLVEKTDMSGNTIAGDAWAFEVSGRFRADDSTLTESLTREIGPAAAEDKKLKDGALVVGESYTLKEKYAPAGYKLSTAETVLKVNTDGTLTITENGGGAASLKGLTGDDAHTIRFKDEPFVITLNKTTELNPDGTALSGAEFKLEKYDGADWSIVKNTDAAPLRTDAGGQIELAGPDYALAVTYRDASGAVSGAETKYRFTETKAADGYILYEKPIEFNIDQNGRLHFAENADADAAMVETDPSGRGLRVRNMAVSVSLQKQDSDARTGENTAMADVAFTLTKGASAGETQTAVTDKDGKLYFGPASGASAFRVAGGNVYTLRETVPTGYENKLSGGIEVTAETDGTVTFEEQSGVIEGTKTTAITVFNTRKTGNVELKKVDADTGGGLNGAEFQIVAVDVPEITAGEVVDTITTAEISGNAGLAESAVPLTWGSYRLVETVPPAGYINDFEPKEFTVDAEHLSFVWTDAVTQITNKKNQLTIYKTDSEDSASYLQAEFVLEIREGENWSEAVLPSFGGNGISISGLARGTYRLTENTAPKGYALPVQSADRQFIFTMGDDGKVTYDPGQSACFTCTTDAAENRVYPNTITMRDNKLKASLKKTDGAEELGGAVFEVSGKFASTPENTAASTITLTDDNREHGLDGQLLGGESYSITETSAPAGYKKPVEEAGKTQFMLEVAEDGALTVSEGNAVLNGTSISVDNDMQEITVEDTALSFSLRKLDDKGVAAPGITFTMNGEFAGETGISSRTLTSSADGTLRCQKPGGTELYTNEEFMKLLYAGETYTLSETPDAASPYEPLAGAVTVTVGADGVLSIPENGEAGFSEAAALSKDGLILTITNVRREGSAALTKKDSQGTESAADDTLLNNVTFELYRKEKTGWTEKAIMMVTGNGYEMPDDLDWNDERSFPEGAPGAEGNLSVSGLEWGEYKLVETKADGYILDADEQSRTCRFVIGPDSTETEKFNVLLGENGIITNEPNTVKIQKADAGDITRKLTGAVFTLTDSANQPVAQWRWDEKGSEGTVERLLPGTYTLTEETAPKGYEKTAPVQFEMKADGSVSLAAGTENAQLMSDDTVGIIVKDTPIIVKVTKTLLGGADSALAGAQFRLEPAAGSTFADGRSQAKEYTTTEDALQIEFDGILAAGSTYILTETKAPAGYVLSNAGTANSPVLPSVTFEVREDGTVSFTATTGLERDVSITGDKTDAVKLADRKTKLYLGKTDNETDRKLAGATLEIYKREDCDAQTLRPNEDAQAVASWKSGTAGSGMIEGLDAGKAATGKEYVLYEAETPERYDSFPPVEFTLHADNTITVAGTAAGRTDLTLTEDNKGNSTISMADTRIRGQVKLTKSIKDEKGGTAEGVIFDLYRQTGAKPDLSEGSSDVKIGTDLVTGKDGTWSSTDNGTDTFIAGEDAGAAFSKGLPTGNYYFLETQATADTVLDSTTPHEFAIGDSDSGAHEKVVTAVAENEAFAAAVSIVKLDEKSGSGILDVEFELKCIPEHKSAKDTLTWTGKTDVDGKLVLNGAPDGEPQFTGLPKGAYTLTETKADGYDISKVHDESHEPFTAEFVIDESDNGQEIAVNSANAKVTKTSGSWSGAGITNPRLLGSVTLYKADGDESSKELAGVNFILQKKDTEDTFIDWIKNLFTGNEYVYKDEADATITGAKLDRDGQLTVKDLDWGTYRLVEKKARDGYSTTDKTSGKTLATVEFEISRTSLKEVDLTVENNTFKNYRTVLQLKKEGTDGVTGLTGAKFTLTGTYVDENGDTVTDGTLPVEVDADGQIVLKGTLIGGERYTLKETEAPRGYELITEPLAFTMNADGTVTADNAVTEKEGYYLTESAFFGNVITAKDTPVQVSLVKKDESGENTLPGVEFKVTPKEGSAFADGAESITLTDASLADGLEAKLVKDNTYLVEEVTAPRGYKKAESFEFTVDADGKVSILTEGAPAQASADSEDGNIEIITVTDEPIKVSFLKRLVGDVIPEGMKGAEFELTPESGKTFADDTDKFTFTSDTDAAVLEALLVGGDTYTLTETKAPDGAMPVPDTNPELAAFTFTVDVHGAVTGLDGDALADGNGITYEEAENRITFWNEPTALMIFKKDMAAAGEDSKLADCTFEITGKFAPDRYLEEMNASESGEDTISITTTGEDTLENALKGRLIVGETYTITEIDPPDGFELGVGVQFTVVSAVMNAQGKLSLVIELAEAADGENNFWIEYDENGNPVILQRDRQVEMKLAKTDLDGNAVVGAAFDVTGIFAGEQEESTRTFRTDANGCADLTRQLIESRTDAPYIYRVQETTVPDGYVGLAGPVYFQLISEMGEDGMRRSEISVLYGSGQTPQGYEEYLSVTEEEDNPEVQTLQIANYQTKLQIRKTGTDSAKGLKGAEFTVTGKFAGTSKRTMTAVTGSDGSITFEGSLVGGEKYLLQETKAPEGYEKLKVSLVFTMGTDGKVSVSAGSGAGYSLTKADRFGNVITVKDQPVKAVPPAGGINKINPQTKTASTQVKAAKTGDDTNAAGYLAMLTAAAAVMILLRKRKKA